MENYLKLHRKMLDWGWYGDINTTRLFIHILLMANWLPGESYGIRYEAGEFITSLEKLAKETHLTISQVRTALKHLEMTGEVASKSQGGCRVITVNNWNVYQASDKVVRKKVASKSQEVSREIATELDIKNKEEKNIYICAFDEFWKIYPRKQDKARAYKCYVARLNDGYTEEQLLTACKNYSKECEDNRTEQRYIKHGSTFLSVNEPFLDYLKGDSDGSDERVRAYEKRKAELEAYIESDEYRNAPDESPFD